ncbi:ATP-binding cassette transporter abc4 [Purpureocillium lavendulum]|uniref:ATP-binding cassette transporter abc4 n=1 Tax=Purpureocillium lavendulum TaxID=1247861 RepID=A0AB34G2C7_9HYPO|nr:ATP-binding cassette transporter abc4 [Purpureocillium lavendulum]
MPATSYTDMSAGAGGKHGIEQRGVARVVEGVVTATDATVNGGAAYSGVGTNLISPAFQDDLPEGEPRPRPTAHSHFLPSIAASPQPLVFAFNICSHAVHAPWTLVPDLERRADRFRLFDLSARPPADRQRRQPTMAAPGLRSSPASWLALLLLSCGLCHAASQTAPTPTITTAPVFIPDYPSKSWSIFRGSILSTNQTASETTYTIFCPTETPAACDISLEFPFIIVEGKSTLKFHGTLTSTYIADLECNMNGTTAATCSGYSSYASGYTNGPHTGPTEVSWTSTLSGSHVQWGTLTLTDKPSTTDNSLDVTPTDITVPTVASSVLYGPNITTTSSDASTPVGKRITALATAVALLIAVALA